MLHTLRDSFKHTSIYTFGNLASKAVGLLLIPVYLLMAYTRVSLYVPMAQPMANRIASALEPDAPGSFVALDVVRVPLDRTTAPIVRVPACDYIPIAQALDAGAQGVMVPRIVGVEDAADAVAIATYPPAGRRGSALARGHTLFRGGDVSAAIAAMNTERLVVIQIETLPSLEACEQIAALDGVDVLFVGPNDLSIALGVPGELSHPLVEAAIERVAAACRVTGRWSALQMNTVESAVRWAPRVDIMSHSAEIGLLQTAATVAVAAVRSAV